MKSGFMKRLEGIIQKTILGGLAVASLVGVSSAVSCTPKPEPTPIVIAVADPWSVSADGTKAYLGYGADGKLVPFDIDKKGNELFSYLTGSFTFKATNILKFEPYSIILGKGGATGSLNYVAVFNKNSELVGITHNVGKSGGLQVVKNYKDIGDLAVVSWEANYSSYEESRRINPENKPILDAIAKALGYKHSGDPGLDQPLIVIGPGLDVQTPGSEPRGKNTTYGAKVSVYKLSTQGSSGISLLEKIASQPPTLSPKYARNQEITSMNLVNEGGNMVLDMKISYEANDGKRYETAGKADLSSLIQSGVPNDPSNVKPVLSLK